MVSLDGPIRVGLGGASPLRHKGATYLLMGDNAVRCSGVTGLSLGFISLDPLLLFRWVRYGLDSLVPPGLRWWWGYNGSRGGLLGLACSH